MGRSYVGYLISLLISKSSYPTQSVYYWHIVTCLLIDIARERERKYVVEMCGEVTAPSNQD